MTGFSPTHRWFAALAACVCISQAAFAQDAVQAELKALREMIEQQSKQIDQLSAQVARLSLKLDARAEGAAVPAAPADTATPGVGTTEFATPAGKQEPPPRPANVHIVVKGESLEKIAKAHGTTSYEIQRLNRISDPKKLQIGQQLILPPTVPPPATPTKQNP
jgi:LysM repeat protein